MIKKMVFNILENHINNGTMQAEGLKPLIKMSNWH